MPVEGSGDSVFEYYAESSALRLRHAIGSQARPGLGWGGVCVGASCVHSIVQV